MTQLPLIAFMNRATTPLGFDLDAFVAAAQVYIDQYVTPAYNVTAKVVRAEAASPDVIPMLFLDDADVEDALADHFTERGIPVGNIFVRTTLAAGESVTASASHELVELMADPLCDKAIQCGLDMPAGAPIQKGDIVPYEPADAVEEDTFDIDGFAFSNFVTPNWFNPLAPMGAKIDVMGLLRSPFQLRPGGYAALTRNGQDATVFGSREKEERFKCEDRRGHRIESLWRPKWSRHLCR